MILEGILVLSTAFAQGPEYTGDIRQKPSTSEKKVNEHIQTTNKKIEIEAQKKEVELKKQAPKNLKAQPSPKKKTPFIVNPNQKQEADPAVFRDQYDHNLGKDPSTEFEQEVIEQRNTPTPEAENAEYIRQFKENAAKAGVKVEVDPNTLRAKPVKNSGGGSQ